MIEAFDIPDLLPRLVDRSLVSYDEATGRYSLLETVRQYSAEHSLNQEDAANLRDRHLDHFLELAADARSKVRGPDQIRWLAHFDAEHDNIRIALDWGLSSPRNFDKAVLLAYELVDYWMIRSSFQESQALLERMSANGDENPVNTCRILIVQFSIGYFTNQPSSNKALEVIQLARKTGDPVIIGDALATAILDLLTGNRVEEARKLRDETLKALELVGDHVMTAFVHINFGNAAFIRGDMDEAEHHYQECYRTRRAAKDIRGVGAALNSLGYVQESRGLYDEAIQLFRQGTSAYFLIASTWDLGGGICCMGLELSTNGRVEDLARILGFGDELLKKVGGQRDRVDTVRYLHWMKHTVDVLGREECDKLRRAGARMTLTDVLTLLFPNGLEVPTLEEKET